MSAPAHNGPKWRNSPFTRSSVSPSPIPAASSGRPKSMLVPSPLSTSQNAGHARHQSLSLLNGEPSLGRSDSTHARSNSQRNSTPAGTFAPKFIKLEENENQPERIRGIEGENDFSGKRYVWLKDDKTAFVRGWVVEELENGRLLVQCDDGTVCYYQIASKFVHYP